MEYSFDNERPIYIQLEDIIKSEIVSRKMNSGDRLPSVREFALAARVNPNTIQKALAELEDLGLIYTESTNGKYVTTNEKLIDSIRTEVAQIKARDYLNDMNSIGIDKNEAIEILKTMGGKQ